MFNFCEKKNNTKMAASFRNGDIPAVIQPVTNIRWQCVLTTIKSNVI
jgi:hypothetical protein